MPASKPRLYILASQHNHDELYRLLCENQTTGIEWADLYGNTVLHVLCGHRGQDPMLVACIRAVVEKRPFLVALPNHASWTPLHLAAERRLSLASRRQQQQRRSRRSDPRAGQPRRADTDNDSVNTREEEETEEEETEGEEQGSPQTQILLTMIRACPEAVSIRRDVGGRRETPFDLACTAHLDVEVLEAMLEADPSLAIMPKAPISIKTALQNLWRPLEQGEDVRPQMALIMLTALHGQVINDARAGERSNLLHAVCYQRVPRPYFEQVLQQHPEQALQLDSRGCLPLHYALENAALESQPYTSWVVQVLLEAEPRAVTVRRTSDLRLPLHIALASKLSWHTGGVKNIVLAESHVLRVVDPVTGLQPFQQAAVHAMKSRNHLSTLLEILLAAPDVLKM